MALDRPSRALRVTAATAAVAASLTAGSLAAVSGAQASVTAPATRGIAAGTRFFIPPPSAGAPQQILQLLASGDRKDAALITEMEAIPRAVWAGDRGWPAGSRSRVGSAQPSLRRWSNPARSRQV